MDGSANCSLSQSSSDSKDPLLPDINPQCNKRDHRIWSGWPSKGLMVGTVIRSWSQVVATIWCMLYGGKSPVLPLNFWVVWINPA